MKRRTRTLTISVVAAALTLVAPNLAFGSVLPLGLGACTHGPSCYLGPVRASFPNYASVCSGENCNFISAANWEQVAAGVTPSIASLKNDYASTGQAFSAGLSMTDLWNYWMASGIDGEYLASETSWRLDRAAIENGVRSSRALIAEIDFNGRSGFGPSQALPGWAVFIVDGYTPKGPLAVFRGRTTQMTWAQWNAQVKFAWKVSTNRVPPSTTTTTTVPTASTTTTTTTTISSSTTPSTYFRYGNQSFSTYGNVYPTALGDCTFAAAANWEQLLFGAQPDPTQIGFEFSQAGGTVNGITMSQFFSYWQQSGIAGYYFHGAQSYYTDQTDVENGVIKYGALIAELQFIQGDYVGSESVSAGSHALVVDGYTPEGPIVVTWGQTIQMSWQQWNAEVIYMYGINASTSPS